MALSTDDIQKISDLFSDLFEEKVRPDIQAMVRAEIKNVIGELPTKGDFAELVGEIQASRQEQVIIGHLLSKHENRITSVEHDIESLQRLYRLKGK